MFVSVLSVVFSVAAVVVAVAAIRLQRQTDAIHAEFLKTMREIDAAFRPVMSPGKGKQT